MMHDVWSGGFVGMGIGMLLVMVLIFLTGVTVGYLVGKTS